MTAAGGRSVLSVLGTVATSWLLVVCSLVVWSLAPVVLGWKPSLVLTGSMWPRIKPGDVVLVEPGRVPQRATSAGFRVPRNQRSVSARWRAKASRSRATIATRASVSCSAPDIVGLCRWLTWRRSSSPRSAASTWR